MPEVTDPRVGVRNAPRGARGAQPNPKDNPTANPPKKQVEDVSVANVVVGPVQNVKTQHGIPKFSGHGLRPREQLQKGLISTGGGLSKGLLEFFLELPYE